MKFYQLVRTYSGWDEDSGMLISHLEYIGMYGTRQQVINEVNSQMESYKLFVIDKHVDHDSYANKEEHDELCEFYAEKVDEIAFFNECFEEDENDYVTVGTTGYNSMNLTEVEETYCEMVELKVLVLDFELNL